MEKKVKGDTTPPGSVVFFPAPLGDLVQPRTEPDKRSRTVAGIPRPVAGAPEFVAVPDLDEARVAFERLGQRPLTVREIADALDADARRLVQYYEECRAEISEGDYSPQELALQVPLIRHLAAGVEVSDIHKLLNVARDPLFEQSDELRGKTAARHFPLEQAIALYMIWRLGHTFHLVPAVRKSIAGQCNQSVLWKVIQGAKMGLAVTPFVALITELDELQDMAHAEVVAFSLNGLICQALYAFHPEPH